VNILDNLFYIDNGNESISSGLGYSYGVSIGFTIGNNVFAEAGYGRYTITQSHKIPSGGVLDVYGYKNVLVSSRYHQLPFRLGWYYFKYKHFRLGSYLGGHYLFNLISTGRKNTGIRELARKKNTPYEGKYELLPNAINWSAVLLNIGFNGCYDINNKLSVMASAGVKMGFRTVTNSGIFVYQYTDHGTVRANSFSTTKGDAIGFDLGITYNFGNNKKGSAGKQ
jgi:hypothetical protein